MKRLTVFAAVLLSMVSCSPEVNLPERWAVLYGVSDYTDPLVYDLSFPDKDAESMAELLLSSGYEENNIIVRTSSAATQENLESDFANLSLIIPRDSLFIFYFSGHGAQITDSSGSTNEYIFLDHPTSVYYEGRLQDNSFMELLAKIPSRQKVVILDACNTGGFIGEFPGVDTIPQDYTGENAEDYFSSAADAFTKYFANVDEGDIPYTEAIVIAAAGSAEVSFEDESLGHGVFTYYFLNTPKNADKNSDGWITAVEAYSYVRERVESDWNAYYPSYWSKSDWYFLPRLSGGPMDFVLFPSR